MLLLSIPGKPPIAIGGISLSPSFVQSDITKENLTYYKQISIPSQVKILQYIWKKYGSKKIEWKTLLLPAIKLAEKGFKMGIHRHHVFKRAQDKLLLSPYHNGELLIDGEIPSMGDIVKQPTLAKTLKRLANYGADDFYKGKIAKSIAKDMKDNGGWITYEDLKNFPEPKEYNALHTTYRGYNIYSFVAPGGGWQVLQAMNLLEHINPSKINKSGFKRDEKLIEVLNKIHNDRLENPIPDYSNPEKQVLEKISKKYAKYLFDKGFKVYKNSSSNKKEGIGETTHFSVIDNDGIAISVTSSIGAYYGSYTATKSLGFFYNSYLKSLMNFGLGKSIEPNTLIPSSMSPSLVRKNGKNVLVIGTPGSKRIVSTICQLIQLWIDGTESITKLIKLPRVHAIKNQAYIENQTVNSNFLSILRQKGYKITFPKYDLTSGSLNAYFGGVHAIEFKNNKWRGAADPRRDGTVKIIE